MPLKLYVYGDLNRVQSSRRLEREAGRNVEVTWLVGRLAPDHKTIADFQRDHRADLQQAYARFVLLCRETGLLISGRVAVDGSKCKAVNNRDCHFTRAELERGCLQIAQSVARYLAQPDTTDRQEPSDELAAKTERLREKIDLLAEEMQCLEGIQSEMLASADQQVSLTDPNVRSMATSGRGSCIVGDNVRIAVETEHHRSLNTG